MTKVSHPELITREELQTKLEHLRVTLASVKCDAVLLLSEGAMRWLTGIKHQLGDIAPSAVSPVNACVKFNASSIKINIISKHFEMPRLKVEMPGVFGLVPGLEYDFSESSSVCEKNLLSPEDNNYRKVIDLAIRPLLGGVSGNQYQKLDWLSNMTMKVLVDTARQLAPGMSGLEVQGILAYNLGKHGIDSNLRTDCTGRTE